MCRTVSARTTQSTKKVEFRKQVIWPIGKEIEIDRLAMPQIKGDCGAPIDHECLVAHLRHFWPKSPLHRRQYV